MNGTDSSAQISEIRCAMRQTNFSDSITQGPRMNAGCFPPMVTAPILRGLVFTARGLIRFRFTSSSSNSLSLQQISQSEWNIKRAEEEQSETMHLEEIKRPPVGKIT